MKKIETGKGASQLAVLYRYTFLLEVTVNRKVWVPSLSPPVCHHRKIKHICYSFLFLPIVRCLKVLTHGSYTQSHPSRAMPASKPPHHPLAPDPPATLPTSIRGKIKVFRHKVPPERGGASHRIWVTSGDSGPQERREGWPLGRGHSWLPRSTWAWFPAATADCGSRAQWMEGSGAACREVCPTVTRPGEASGLSLHPYFRAWLPAASGSNNSAKEMIQTITSWASLVAQW